MTETWRGWLVGGAAIIAAAPASAEGYSIHRDHVLGTSFDMLVSSDAEAGGAASAAALGEIARLDKVLSGWRDDSELAALNHAHRFRVSRELFDLIIYGERLRHRTSGVFSPRLGHVMRAWRSGVPGSARALLELAQAAERAPLWLDVERQVIERPEEIRFDLDAYAKGYVIDQALAAARRAAPHARGQLINLGGDVAAWGEAPSGGAWRVGVARPGVVADNAAAEEVVMLRDGALAMSGGGARDFKTAEGATAHFVSALTGQAASTRQGAAVVAESAMEADALATAFALMSPHDAVAFAEQEAGVAARVFAADDATHTSRLWRAETPNLQLCQVASATPWPESYALDVAFEIPRVNAGNYERPNVSIWISDEDRRLVRTLLVLGVEPRWRETNYIWWRRNERYNAEAVQAMARPTRAPGRYHVVWDGRDDAGVPVGHGRYTINIEASREHGGHSFQSVALDLGEDRFSETIEAQNEIGAAVVRFGPQS